MIALYVLNLEDGFFEAVNIQEEMIQDDEYMDSLGIIGEILIGEMLKTKTGLLLLDILNEYSVDDVLDLFSETLLEEATILFSIASDMQDEISRRAGKYGEEYVGPIN